MTTAKCEERLFFGIIIYRMRDEIAASPPQLDAIPFFFFPHSHTHLDRFNPSPSISHFSFSFPFSFRSQLAWLATSEDLAMKKRVRMRALTEKGIDWPKAKQISKQSTDKSVGSFGVKERRIFVRCRIPKSGFPRFSEL